ncbi:MAG: alanine racemase [Planctomycetota bacterium]
MPDMPPIESWLQLDLNRPDELNTPALLIDSQLVDENISEMLRTVGGDAHAKRLCPHIKTTKSPDVIREMLKRGVRSFKASTVAEVELAASAGADQILLAHPVVPAKWMALERLHARFPEVELAVISDDSSMIDWLNQRMPDHRDRNERSIRVLIDVDCGMHRTGAPLVKSDHGTSVLDLWNAIRSSPHLDFGGFHVYDGHVHQGDRGARENAVRQIWNDLNHVIEDIATRSGWNRDHVGKSAGSESTSPTIIVGGSPTFPIWSQIVLHESNPSHTNPFFWKFSPGTTTYWDYGYAGLYPELKFKIATAVVTSVISRPGNRRLCLDLGTKSVATEMPLKERVWIPQFPGARCVVQNEEHLVIECADAKSIPIGTRVLAFPRHVCPTIARYPSGTLVRCGEITNHRWEVLAR